ncbi:MAG: serine/threonine protein kinase [Hyphomonadaceae bacterium]|nr:serine/threonine protein kinase [Hyphomonadaceae bacterium]
MPAKPAPTENLLALPEGTELVGDYRIKRVLGAGGFGITYLADEKALARLVTIKEYFPADFAARRATNASPRSQEVAGDYQWGLDRFIDEAQTLARFDHPNIVRVHRYFRANNTAYMVLHFEEGGSFKSWLKGLRRAPRQAELDTMVAPLLDALEIIHRANFLHRDIAPDNIMVRKDGSPVLIDFGSARGQIASHSRTVSALVKPGYSPYEQYATTSSSQGPWTDIYALGATLYHAIAGKRPPDAPSRVVSDEYVKAAEAALSAYRSGFLGAIDKALQLEVGERPQSIAQWRGDLFATEPKRSPGRLGLRLPIARTLGRLSGATVPPAPAAQAAAPAPPEATVASTEPTPSLVPAPPDAPQPKGQLLDFIDALKKHRPPILTPKRKKEAPAKPREPAPPPAAPREPAAAQPEGDAQFGLGYGPRPEPAQAGRPPAPKSTPKPRPPPRVLRRAAAERRAPPKPRRVWRLPSRRWRSVIFKVAVAVAIASLAVAYQDSAPRTQARGAGMIASQTADLAQTMQLLGHKGPVVAAASSDQGRWIVSAGADGTLRVWNAGSGALVRTIELDEGAPTALAVGNRRALTGHRGGTIVLWELEHAERIGTYQLGSAAAASLAFTADPNVFAAAAQDGSVALFDSRAPSSPSMLLDGRDGAGLIVAASGARGFVASAGADRTVRLWRTETHSLARTYRGQGGEIAALDISSDGRYLAAAIADGSIRVWSNSSSRAVRTFKTQQARVGAIAFGPDRLFATASDDGKIKVWNLRTARMVRTLGGAGRLRALNFAADGRRIIGAGQDGVIRVWSLDAMPAGGT